MTSVDITWYKAWFRTKQALAVKAKHGCVSGKLQADDLYTRVWTLIY